MSASHIKLEEAFALHQNGQLAQAKSICEQILITEPTYADALHLLGMIAYQTNNAQLAIELFDRAIKIDSNRPAFYSNRGSALLASMQLEAAVESYDHAIALKPDFADAYFNRGNALHELGQLSAAVESYNQAINLNSNFAAAYSNRGNVLQELEQLNEAVESYDCAIAIQPDFSDAYFNRGNVLQKLKQSEKAIESYDCAIAINPNYAEAYLKRGNVLQELNLSEKAIQSYDAAIVIDPNYADAYVNRGLVLNALKQYEKAVENYNHAIAIKPDFVDAYFNRGNSQRELRQAKAVAESFEKAIALQPNFEYLLGMLLFAKMKLCDWRDFEANISTLIKGIGNDEKTSPGFPIFSLIDAPSIQRHASEMWLKNKFPVNFALGDIPKHEKSEKMRIGYFSPDFHLHPVLILLVELFEYHDKDRFELIAFSLSPDSEDEVRQRAEQAFDQFIDVRHYTNKEVAILARDMNIDIAIDLGGGTHSTRPGIFAYRAAPIQVNYLGYPGSLGADHFDYLIADQTIIPKEYQQYYAEKIAYLPHCYQPGDTKREIAAKEFTKQELGLPNEGFVFCCFNNNYKITPDVFDGWMRILTSITDSVLYICADSECAEKNLQKEAQARGVDPGRLIFAKRLKDRSEYLARCKAMDLFLDTFPYSAHATANDVLWAGLPVLTLAGKSFASRVAASLLNALELSELITHTQEDYEALAIELATNPAKLNAIKTKLTANRLTTPLFNTALFTKNIENAYTQMFERYQANLLPDYIYVE